MTYTHPIPQHNNPLTGIQIIEKDSPGSPACARLSLTDNSPEPLRRPKPRRFPSRFYRDPRCPRFVELVSAAQRTLLYRLACECRELQAPLPGFTPTSPGADVHNILIYDPGWIPQRVFLKTESTFKSLGVEYPINPGDSTSFATMKLKLIQAIRAISIKKASARAVNVVLSKCLYNRGAFVGVLSSWSLAQCEELDEVFATKIRRRTKNM